MDRDKRATLGALAGLAASLAVTSPRAQPARLAERAIPASGETLPVVGVGTWQVGTHHQRADSGKTDAHSSSSRVIPYDVVQHQRVGRRNPLS